MRYVDHSGLWLHVNGLLHALHSILWRRRVLILLHVQWASARLDDSTVNNCQLATLWPRKVSKRPLSDNYVGLSDPKRCTLLITTTLLMGILLCCCLYLIRFTITIRVPAPLRTALGPSIDAQYIGWRLRNIATLSTDQPRFRRRVRHQCDCEYPCRWYLSVLSPLVRSRGCCLAMNVIRGSNSTPHQ